MLSNQSLNPLLGALALLLGLCQSFGDLASNEGLSVFLHSSLFFHAFFFGKQTISVRRQVHNLLQQRRFLGFSVLVLLAMLLSLICSILTFTMQIGAESCNLIQQLLCLLFSYPVALRLSLPLCFLFQGPCHSLAVSLRFFPLSLFPLVLDILHQRSVLALKCCDPCSFSLNIFLA